MVVYLVRSFRTYARIRSLTTGTFNLVVKDRIAFRLSGAPSVLDGLAASSESGCPRNPSNISFAQNPVNTRIPQYFHVFSTLGICSGRAVGELKSSKQRATISPSALDFCKDADSSAHAEAEDRKLRKDPKLEVLALKVPFRNLQVVSESSPVGRDD